MRRPMFACVILAFAAGCSSRGHASPETRLTPCVMDQGPADASCGRVPVWENRAAQRGRRIDLKVIVLPARKAVPLASPLFVLAGGPGQGAAALVDTWAQLLVPVQRDRDIVLVDTRGTGASDPLHCREEEAATQDADRETSPLDELRQCLASYRDYADVTQFTTANAMDDLDDVRRYLGYSTVDLYGVSYGSRAALVYLDRHPDSVRSVVLDSVLAPANHLPFFVARDAQRAFDLLARDCSLDEGCRHRFPDFKDSFRRLLSRLAVSPPLVRYRDRIGVDREIEITRARVAGVVLNALYFPELSADLPFLLNQAERGDFDGLLALEETLATLRESVALGLQHSVLCSEDVAPALQRRESTGFDTTFLGPDAERAAERACAVWPEASPATQNAEPTRPNVPALLISGELDPVTPPEWGELVAQGWPRAQHLIVPGSAHNASASECIVNLMADFLRTQAPVAADTPCLVSHHRPAFVIDASGPAIGPEHSR